MIVNSLDWLFARRRCRACGLVVHRKVLVHPWHACSEDCADEVWNRVTQPAQVSDHWLTLLTCLALCRSAWRPTRTVSPHQESAHRRKPSGAASVR